MSNTYGELFRITTFGESHGRAVGVVVDGCPPGLEINEELIQYDLDRRRPGQSSITSSRKEKDNVQILSGVFEGKTTGASIALLVWNEDVKSEDYDHLREQYRPSHADYTYHLKYGIRDYRGGGRSSARETLARVAAGVIAKQFLGQKNIIVKAYVSQVGHLKLNASYDQFDLSQIEENVIRCPDQSMAQSMIALIEEVRQKGDTVGGVITGVIKGLPPGLGEPVFDKFQAELAKAMMSIPAAKGFEYGSGFEGASMFGSLHNDVFEKKEGKIQTKTNYSGGIQGGITNGQDVYFRIAFKPVSTIMQDQETVNENGEKVTLKAKGRHDPCVLPRAVPIVEAMARLVVIDFYLRNNSISINGDN